jgi:hypothetical protein
MSFAAVCYSVDKNCQIVGNADYWFEKKEYVSTLWIKPNSCSTAYLLGDRADTTPIHISTVLTGTTGILYLSKNIRRRR